MLSSFNIATQLATAVYIMMVSTRMKVNGWEWTFIRCGFSIYSGWLTTATILNIVIMLKFLGVNDSILPTWLDEELISIILLYIASFIYNLASYVELNPLYGAVYVWVVLAIRNKIITEKPQYTDLETNLDILGIFQALSMTALTAFTAVEAYYEVDVSDRGLFYN